MTPHFKAKGYWALILGGSSGIGLATAHKLAEEGMNCCIVHRDRKSKAVELEMVWDELRAKGVQIQTFNADALKEEKRQEILTQLKDVVQDGEGIRVVLHAISKGNLKLLVPNTNFDLGNEIGIEDKELLGLYRQMQQKVAHDYEIKRTELTGLDYQLTIEAMAISLYDWVKAIFQEALFAQDARVFGLTSEGNTKAWRYYAAVSAAKASLEAISRAIALEFAPYGIRSNIIQAGVTDTPSLRMIPGQEQLKANAVFRNPFHRLTQATDVANVIYLLSRDEAAWINGTIIPVDGGERNS